MLVVEGALIHCWRKCKQCSHYGNQYGGSSKKLKPDPPYDPAIPFLGIYPKK
jgi:hypothetical protein